MKRIINSCLTVCAVLATMAAPAVAADAQKPDRGSTAGIAPYESALRGYRGFSDAPVADWRSTNDTVARIGGWRAYAKESFEARQRDTKPTAGGARQ